MRRSAWRRDLGGDAAAVGLAWAAGRPVAGAELLVLGAEPYLYEDELGLEWKLCEVPSAALPRWVDAGAALGSATGKCREEEEGRFASVRAWYAAEGGPLAATAGAPVICLLGPGEGCLHLLDGWHRATVAAHEHGLAPVHALVAPANPEHYDDEDDWGGGGGVVREGAR